MLITEPDMLELDARSAVVGLSPNLTPVADLLGVPEATYGRCSRAGAPGSSTRSWASSSALSSAREG